MIRLGNPAVGEAEIAAVSEAIRAGTLSTGDIVDDFEMECADLAGRAHAAAVASGSIALELAIHTSDLTPGAGILVSPFNCAAVLYSVLREGCTPVFADIDPETYNLAPGTAEAAADAADQPVEAIVAAHLYGQPCEMDALERLAEQRGLTLIEDYAQAVGAEYRGSPAGSFGDVGVASFGATKNLTTAEGGVVVSDTAQRIDRVRSIRSNTNPPIEGETLRSVRMNDLEAAIGREQISKYDDIIARKRAISTIYDERLSDVVKTPVYRDHATHVFHGYPIRTPQRDALLNFLAGRDIESAAVYDTPLYEYPQVEAPNDPTTAYPHTQQAVGEVLLLPIHGSLSREDANAVADGVEVFFEDGG